MNKAIISAPFGSYLTIPGATSTRGTYTADKRPGAIFGALTRINFTRQGILNKMCLRNPGIKSQDFDKHEDVIWSIGGMDRTGWKNVVLSVPEWVTVELNCSCPNIDDYMYREDWIHLFNMASSRFFDVIVKLPPNFKQASMLFNLAYNNGITTFHCCNTIKTNKGGLSGRAIQKYSLPIIEHIKRTPGITAIGGGGIYSKSDVKRYRNAGADKFSLGTIFFMPWKVPGVMREINK